MSTEPVIGSTVLPLGTEDVVWNRLFPAPDPYTDDPIGWVHAKLGEETWSKQDEILLSVRDNRFTAVKACHGPGKSYTAGRAVGWWLDTHPLGSAFAVTTAPSWPQVEAILWREIRRTHAKGHLRGRVTLDCQWHMSDAEVHRKTSDPYEELIAMGRKPQDYDQTAFQGIHAQYVLVVVDEASGIPPILWEAIETLVTNEQSRVLAIGNPDDPESYFANNCKDNSDYNVITISAFDTPAFTGEPVSQTLLDVLTSKTWVEERRRKWGEGSIALDQ